MITIRDMQIDDLGQVIPIENENFSVPWSETGFFTFLIRADAIFLVAEENREILGYCGVLTVLDEGDITNVAVKKCRQGQGIGKMLVEELIKRVTETGVATLHLEVRESNAPAISLYEKLGFVQQGIRRNYYEAPTEDGIMMVKR